MRTTVYNVGNRSIVLSNYGSLIFLLTTLSAIIAAKIYPHLRLHALGVLFSGGLWGLFWIIILNSSLEHRSFDDNVSGIAQGVNIECCSSFLICYHTLFCLAFIINFFKGGKM